MQSLKRVERETPHLIPKEMKLIKQIVSTAAPPLSLVLRHGSGSKGKVEDETLDLRPLRHLPLRSKSLLRVCQQPREETRVAVKSASLWSPFISTSYEVQATQLHALFTFAPRGGPELGHRQSSSCKKGRSAKAIYQTRSACPETRTNVLDIEERERERERRNRERRAITTALPAFRARPTTDLNSEFEG